MKDSQFIAPFLAPRKSLGQNFLQDQNITRKIVAALNVVESDVVVEIGPGRGALTNHLLDQAGELHVIEFDRDLVEYWLAKTSQHPNLNVHGADVLNFDLANITNSEGSKQRQIKVIGNLPYNISSPVLFHLMNYASSISTQVLMLQKEVVERMAAEPNNKQYGRLSVMLQQRYHIEHLFNVSPNAFYPPPKVDSAIARLSPLRPELHPVDDHAQFEALVKQAFAQRRKTLRNNLKGLLGEEQILAANINPGTRAETLHVSDFVALNEQLK